MLSPLWGRFKGPRETTRCFSTRSSHRRVCCLSEWGRSRGRAWPVRRGAYDRYVPVVRHRARSHGPGCRTPGRTDNGQHADVSLGPSAASCRHSLRPPRGDARRRSHTCRGLRPSIRKVGNLDVQPGLGWRCGWAGSGLSRNVKSDFRERVRCRCCSGCCGSHRGYHTRSRHWSHARYRLVSVDPATSKASTSWHCAALHTGCCSPHLRLLGDLRVECRFVAPAFAAHRFYSLYREERDARQALDEVNSRLQRANLSFASALVATLDARDRYTAGHSAAVAVYARDIADRMGLSEENQRLAHLCGLVHDIGKIGLPPGLLEKPGALTLDERRQMEQHSEIGERILANVEDYAEIARIVRHHHERMDGNGYPDGIAGGDIPLLSRIISVADAYNAMTSDRPYRDAMPSRVARLRLAQAVEAQFDTDVVAAFEAILAGSNEAYRAGLNLAFETEASVHEALSLRAAIA